MDFNDFFHTVTDSFNFSQLISEFGLELNTEFILATLKFYFRMYHILYQNCELGGLINWGFEIRCLEIEKTLEV